MGWHHNSRASDSKERHEIPRGETTSIHLGGKEKNKPMRRAHKIKKKKKKKGKNQTSSVGRSHGMAIRLIRLSMLQGWHCKDIKSLIHPLHISPAHLVLHLGGKVEGG